MGFIIGVLKQLTKRILYLAVFVAIIVLIPNLPPYTKFTSIKLEPTQPLVGPLAINGALNNIEKLYVGKLLGPEAFQIFDGELYTSLSTGEIVKISSGGHITFVTKIGQPCTGSVQEHICGKPLGFEIDEKNSELYVADAYYGIWKVNLKTDKKQLLVSPQVQVEGRSSKIFNFVSLDKKNNVYYTDSSSDFLLKDGVFTMLSDPSGRLFQYDAVTNTSKVLLDNLWFANGLTVSADGQFLIVTESMRYRLIKYYIDGPRKGQSEVFVAGLPGIVDNVRSLPDGSGVLVALYTAFNDEHPLLSRSVAATPHIRKFIARLMRLIEIPFEFLYTQFPHYIFENIVHTIGHFKTASYLAPPISGLVQIDWNGNIIASYYNTDGSTNHISDAIVYNGKLYLGNPRDQDFIGAVPVPELLKKAFITKPLPSRKTIEPTIKEEKKPKIEVKPQQNVQKPKPVEAVTSKPVETEKPKKLEQKPTTKPATNQHPKPTQSAPEEAKRATSKSNEEKKTPRPEQVDTKHREQSKVTDTTTATPTTKPVQPQTDRSKTKNIEKEEKQQKPVTKDTSTPPSNKPAPDQTSKQTNKPPQQISKPAPEPSSKPAPEQIPIKEEIPSDTVKPSKETLRVIKKNGPTEIPNPNL